MNVLHLLASSNQQSSITKEYGKKVLEQLEKINGSLHVKSRHTTYPALPYVDEAMLDSYFAKDERTPEQKEAVKLSDELVEELNWADVLVVSSPIYNFSVPASLKAYFDLVARAGMTFKYTESGPVGLLKNKKAIVVMSSGGTQIGSDIDFAGRYVAQFLGFLGITKVTKINLDLLMIDGEKQQQKALQAIERVQL